MSAAVPYLDAPPLERYGLVPVAEVGTSPAAGAAFVYEIAGGFYVRLLAVTFRLVTSADVADRYVGVQYRDGSDAVILTCGPPVAQTASTTTDYSFHVWQSQAEWPVAGDVIVPLAPLMLSPGYDFRIVVDGIQAADALSVIRFVPERFFTG